MMTTMTTRRATRNAGNHHHHRSIDVEDQDETGYVAITMPAAPPSATTRTRSTQARHGWSGSSSFSVFSIVGILVMGSCLVWQLLWIKHLTLALGLSAAADEDHHQHLHHPNRATTTTTTTIPSTASSSSSSSTDTTSSSSLVQHELIREVLLREAPWAESHGADHWGYLGAGLLYYAFAYAFRSETIVVLGSGGGYVPRLLKQAQRDLLSSGIRPNGRNKKYEVYLVDAHLPSAGWGSTFYADNENTTMHTEYEDINYIFQLTDDAYTNYFLPRYVASNFRIDYLHIDADHGFAQSWKDFEQYSKLVSDRAIISFHDTCYDNVTRQCHADGVPETIAKLQAESTERQLQVIDMPYLYRGIAFAVPADTTSPAAAALTATAAVTTTTTTTTSVVPEEAPPGRRRHRVVPAVEAPHNRRLNFCTNNAERLTTTAEGFTKNGRTSALTTLGDFMECDQRYNITDLVGVATKNTPPPPPQNENHPPPGLRNGIMALPCPHVGFRRNHIQGRCDKCIPGMLLRTTGAEDTTKCGTYQYASIRAGTTNAPVIPTEDEDEDEDNTTEDDDEADMDDIVHLAKGWLRSALLPSTPSTTTTATTTSTRRRRYSTPTPKNYLELGSHAFMSSSASKKNKKKRTIENSSASFSSSQQHQQPLFFGSLLMHNNNNKDNYNIGDVIVIDPISVPEPVWVDPSLSTRYRFLPCTLEDAIQYDRTEHAKAAKASSPSSSSQPLDLETIDTLLCLSCDDLMRTITTMGRTNNSSNRSDTTTKKSFPEFLRTDFPHVRTMILGMTEHDNTAKEEDINQLFLTDLMTTLPHQNKNKNTTTTALSPSSWKLDRDLILSVGGRDKDNLRRYNKRLVLLTLSASSSW